MKCFAAFLGVILILEVVAGILGFVFRGKLESVLADGMYTTLGNYNNDSSTQTIWDDVQVQFYCCGVKNATDWRGKYTKDARSVPDSCCKTPTRNCGNEALTKMPSAIYWNGCLAVVEQTLGASTIVIGSIAIAVAVVQLIGIIFACCLASAIKKDYESV